MPDIPRAERGLLYRNGDPDVRRHGRIIQIGKLQRLFQNRGDLARDPDDALAVGTVRGNGDIEKPVVKPHDLLRVVSRRSILFAQNQDPVNLRAVVKIVVDAEFFAGTEHAFGNDPAQLSRFDLLYPALVQHRRAVERAGNERAFEHVGRGGTDLFYAVSAAVHRAYGKPVRVRMFFAFRDLPDNHVRHVFPETGEFFHFESAGKELLLQFLGGNINVHIVF